MSLLMVFSLCVPPLARAAQEGAEAEDPFPDRIVVEADTLRGRVGRLNPDALQFTTRYGKGAIQVPYDSLQAAMLVGDFVLLYGEHEEVRGTIVTIREGVIVIGVTPDSVANIPVSSLRQGVALEDFGDRWIDRMRRRYRYWRGDLNVAWKFEDGAVDKRKIEAGISLQRRKEPTRLVVDHEQKFETQKQSNPSEELTTEDEFRSLFSVEYDLAKRFFAYAQPGMERDIPRKVQIRAYPNAGVGKRFIDSKRWLVQIGLGLAYVYEEFIGVARNDYTGLHLNAEYRWTTALGPEISGFVLYLPEISTGEQWLFRSEMNIDVPLLEILELRWKVTNVSDNNPSPEVGNNKITTNLGLVVKFP